MFSWEFYEAFQDNYLEAVARGCSVKKLFLNIFPNSQENTCHGVSVLIKVQVLSLQLY